MAGQVFLPSATAGNLNQSRRRFCRTTAGGIIVAATSFSALPGCSEVASVPDSAISAWLQTPQFDDIRRWALSFAILAPNPHNLQPWRFDLSTEDEVVVSIDPERVLPETDPYGRQIVIGTGAMLGLLQIAAATRGYQVDYEWVGPLTDAATADGSTESLPVDHPIVRVRLSQTESAGSQVNQQRLFDHILHRHTVRGPYEPSRPVNNQFSLDIADLVSASQSAAVISRKSEPELFDSVSSLVKEGWRVELSTPDAAMESIRLLRVGSREIQQHRDGIVIDSLFIVMLDRLGLMDRTQALEPGSRIFNTQIDDFNAAVDSTPGWVWLTSTDNSRLSQLEAGISYVKIQLMATAKGMVMHPVSQGLQEYDEVRPVYTQLQEQLTVSAENSDDTLQMLARIGYLPQNSKDPMPSPRRGLAAHI